jgi:hypothetical protein
MDTHDLIAPGTLAERIGTPCAPRIFDVRRREVFEASAELVPGARWLDHRELDAEPYDVPGVALSHAGEACSFDAFLARFALHDPALQALATIVRGADTARPDLAPQSAGLLAMSLGLSALYRDDHAVLAQGYLLYDALLAWLREARDERHGWPPAG